ncbi:MAG: phosphoglycerate kinase [Albidovulum sp.]|nr:phosphoglycerate kinase [Albidovulum sp.]
MKWKSLEDLPIAGNRVLVRVDINVPFKNGRVSDATRINRIFPTIRDIRDMGGKVVLMAHLGRPRGRVLPEFSLANLLSELQYALNCKVCLVDAIDSADAPARAAIIPDDSVALLENTRFHPGEESNCPSFAASLARFGDIFCNDAFSASHRAHASTEGIAHLLPNCAGRLLQAELSALNSVLGRPERPLAAIVGGAKVSTKLAVLKHLVGKTDYLIVGGGMANTFHLANGLEVGKSLSEVGMLELVGEIAAAAKQARCEIVIPVDIVIAEEFRAGANSRTVSASKCPNDAMILDCGPATVRRISDVLCYCRTLLWNGPLGAFEIEPFDHATSALAAEAASLTRQGKLLTVAGGGDTVAALRHSGHMESFSYVSTAGGAFLEWMEGKVLPGIRALES